MIVNVSPFTEAPHHHSAPSLESSLMITSSTELAFMSKAGSASLRASSFCSSVRI